MSKGMKGLIFLYNGPCCLIITSANESYRGILWCHAFVCLLYCHQDTWKSYWQLWTKFCGMMYLRLRTNRLEFGTGPDSSLDTGSGFLFSNGSTHKVVHLHPGSIFHQEALAEVW